MKKSLLITTSLLTLGVVTGIYAQTTGATGTIVDKMKAVAHSFTLSASLNPTDTSLSSDPIKGKKTGDILTAGEYNRILELISEGGGGGSGWVDVPLTGTENFDDSCMYRFQITYTSGGREPFVPKETRYYVNGVSPAQLVWWLENDSQMSTYHIAASSKNILRINGTPYTTGGVSVTKIEKLCGGGSGSSNIIKGTATVAFYNGQPHSTMTTVNFGRTCNNPVITVQSTYDSIACGNGSGVVTCATGGTSQDLHAYFGSVTSSGFQVYLSATSGVWVGASSPAFGINYIVACD